MHKYKPRVHIIRHDPRLDLSQIQSLPAEGVHTFSFPETEFTTVTAYQNQQVHVPPLKNTAKDKQKLSLWNLEQKIKKKRIYTRVFVIKRTTQLEDQLPNYQHKQV